MANDALALRKADAIHRGVLTPDGTAVLGKDGRIVAPLSNYRLDTNGNSHNHGNGNSDCDTFEISWTATTEFLGPHSGPARDLCGVAQPALPRAARTAVPLRDAIFAVDELKKLLAQTGCGTTGATAPSPAPAARGSQRPPCACLTQLAALATAYVQETQKSLAAPKRGQPRPAQCPWGGGGGLLERANVQRARKLGAARRGEALGTHAEDDRQKESKSPIPAEHRQRIEQDEYLQRLQREQREDLRRQAKQLQQMKRQGRGKGGQSAKAGSEEARH